MSLTYDPDIINDHGYKKWSGWYNQYPIFDFYSNFYIYYLTSSIQFFLLYTKKGDFQALHYFVGMADPSSVKRKYFPTSSLKYLKLVHKIFEHDEHMCSKCSSSYGPTEKKFLFIILQPIYKQVLFF